MFRTPPEPAAPEGFFVSSLSEAFVMRKQGDFEIPGGEEAEFFVLQKPKGRFDRSPGYIFVGGEERGYFALDKAGSNPAGACIVPWRRSRKGRRDAGSERETLSQALR